MKKNVKFKSNNLNLSGHLYIPENYKEGEKRAAIVVSHPFGGVKEQTAGLYAEKLSKKGFITLAFDASYQGESEGEPRFMEDPFVRAEDIKSAVTFLSIQNEVDSKNIGILGICASGGYVTYAAQTDHRIKAIATVSAADMGDLFREGLGGNASPEVLETMLDESGKARTEAAKGNPIRLDHIVPNSPEEVTEGCPTLYKEGTDYYRTPRAQHPNSPNWYIFSSVDKIAQYSSFDRINMISPRPLLLIVGTLADTAYFSEIAYNNAKQPKEIFWVEGATHIDLYDKPEYVNPAIEKMNAFFKENLVVVAKHNA